MSTGGRGKETSAADDDDDDDDDVDGDAMMQ